MEKIIVIGQKNCSACEMTKTILKNKGVEFEYKLLDDLENDLKNKYIKIAKEQNKLSLPLIIKDEKILTVQEVIA